MFAYGYWLHFSERNETAPENELNVLEVDSIDLKKFTYQLKFENNQNRKVFVRSDFDFTNFETLKEWLFVVENIVSFHCNRELGEITFSYESEGTYELMHYWLIHMLIPMYATLSGKYYLLHAGSVSVEEKAILFTGSSYAGKSTLTDFFLQRGHTLVSDDKIATYYNQETFFCTPSHCFHRPYRKMESLGVEAKCFQTNALEISSIYWITPVSKNEEIEIRVLHGLKKFQILRFSTQFDMHINKENRFNYLVKLAEIIPIYEINIPRDLDKLEEVYTRIIEHQKVKEVNPKFKSKM